MPASPQQILAFAFAVREGSFSAAALRLGVSQSAVSQHVAALERVVGAPLLVRERAGLTLTRQGRDLFDLAERHATLRQLIDERVEAYAALERGHLTVIANAPRPALVYLAAFRHAHPGVEVAFTLYDWTTAMRLLRERRVDVAVVTAPRAWATRSHGASARRATTSTWSPTTRWPGVPPSRSRSSRARPCCCRRRARSPSAWCARPCTRHGTALGQVIETTTFPVMVEAVLHGVGVGGVFLEDSAHPSIRLASRPIPEMDEAHDHLRRRPSRQGRPALGPRLPRRRESQLRFRGVRPGATPPWNGSRPGSCRIEVPLAVVKRHQGRVWTLSRRHLPCSVRFSGKTADHPSHPHRGATRSG